MLDGSDAPNSNGLGSALLREVYTCRYRLIGSGHYPLKVAIGVRFPVAILASWVAICYTTPMSVKHDHDYDTDPRVLAAEDALWHVFKGDYCSVGEATEAIHAMAVVAIRAIDTVAN